MAKPSSHIDWTDGNVTKVVEPSVAKKLLGWVGLERPTFEHMNFNFFRLDEWAKYFEVTTDALLSLQSSFDVVIGAGGTHATLNAAVADAGLGVDQRVLVIDPATLTSTQILSKAGWEITFKASAVYSQGLTTTPGIRLAADRVKLISGRFTDFDGGSDIAVEVAAGAKNCLITQCYFANVDTDINDLGTNTSLSSNVVEV